MLGRSLMPEPRRVTPQEVADAWNVVHMALSAQRGEPQQLLAESGIVTLAGLLRQLS